MNAHGGEAQDEKDATGPVRADKGEPARKPPETRSGTETRNLANPFPGIQLLFIFGGLKKENQIKPTSMSAYKKGNIFFVVLHFCRSQMKIFFLVHTLFCFCYFK